MTPSPHNLIVIGAGHAGIEAAHIAAKMGVPVLLITGNPDLIGQMSCNPAIGGVAKGNIVREIDALGGLMASLIDRTGIHFRMLNASKGSAVWGPRAQADKTAYRNQARQAMENNPNIAILQSMVVKLGVSGERISSVTLDSGETISAKAVILAAGTFLNGVIQIGLHTQSGGRAGEPPACGLTESIRELGITSGRLKTGTPPRIDGRTVDYSRLSAQHGDDDPWPFSFFTRDKLINRIVCWSARTTAETHQHVLENMDKLPQYMGKTQSAGPRYCPLIEDKIVRFGERDGHTLYLEPESIDNHELYVNGLFTSLPYGVQERMIRSIKGLEGARIVRPGYGIEYDYFQPLQLRPTLESRAVRGLFFAGQVNGTSGYEEAACQGLVAGINAVRGLRGEEPVILGRDTSYIGVLIDDLVTKGTDEPYRMFTSRAEYRLILRQDNCDERLMPVGYGLGTITAAQYDERRRFWDQKRELAERLGGVKVSPDEYGRMVDFCVDTGAAGTGGISPAAPSKGSAISQTESAKDLLRRPEVGIERLLRGLDDIGKGFFEGNDDGDVFDRGLTLGVESDIKYEGFVRKQFREIERIRRYEETRIPDGFSYDDVPGLLTESREKLKKICPGTVGQASRIGGVTPADISVLAMYLLKSDRR
jgi:tRNA uridine 5-carboxymethylaminomethyl modification enzyme